MKGNGFETASVVSFFFIGKSAYSALSNKKCPQISGHSKQTILERLKNIKAFLTKIIFKDIFI